MSNLRPIEPGCKAIIVWSVDAVIIGQQVDVVNYIPNGSRDSQGDIYHNVASGGVWEVSFSDGCYGGFEEQYLMRIDGFEDDKTMREIVKEMGNAI